MGAIDREHLVTQRTAHCWAVTLIFTSLSLNNGGRVGNIDRRRASQAENPGEDSQGLLRPDCHNSRHVERTLEHFGVPMWGSF